MNEKETRSENIKRNEKIACIGSDLNMKVCNEKNINSYKWRNGMKQKRVKKRSLGGLRKTLRSSAKAPELLGEMRPQRSTLSVLIKQLSEHTGDEIVCNLAGWNNRGKKGPFLTVELSPRYVRNQQPANNDNLLEQLFSNDDEETTNEISE
jgi:hypothetical protein